MNEHNLWRFVQGAFGTFSTITFSGIQMQVLPPPPPCLRFSIVSSVLLHQCKLNWEYLGIDPSPKAESELALLFPIQLYVPMQIELGVLGH
jgi:hypothetical protein